MKWNPEQHQAIHALGKNTLVCASAGAGKTAVLVERLTKRCLVDRVPMDRIVAMTFTEAAASEMKKRLSRRLNQELLNSPHDSSYIRNQLALLQNAQISTIHSFCMFLIKKHYDVIGLDPALPSNILSEGCCLQAKEKAFSATFNQLLKQNTDSMTNLCSLFSSRSEDINSLKKTVFSIIETASTSFDPEEWYTNATSSYQPLRSEKELPQQLMDVYFGSVASDLTVQQELLSACHKALMLEKPDHEKGLQAIQCRQNFLDAAKEASLSKQLDLFVQSFRRSLSKSLKTVQKAPEYAACKKEFNEHSKECIKNYLDFDLIRTTHNHSSPLALLLLQLAKQTHQAYTLEKQQLKGLEFNDMETYAYAILKANNGIVASFYQSFFQEILVDEFQDTNEIQNEIINAISNGKNAFRVGDVKQSIYRFRHAKPDLMRQLMKDSNTLVIHLSYNYRSNEAIVDFNNDLFSKLMNIPGCKDHYDDTDHVAAGTDNQKETYNPVEFYGLVHKELNKNPEETLETKQIKATFIASKIIEMKKSTPFKKWSDYVILTKSHADKLILKSAFDQANIPYSIDAKEGFYKSDVIQIVLSFLRLMLDKYNEIALVSVLSSPLYKTSADELALSKLNYPSLLQGCIQTNHPLMEDLSTALSLLQQEGLSAVLTWIASINNFYEDELNLQQKTNFDFLFEKISTFEQTSRSLRQFLTEVDLSFDEKSDEAVSLGSQEDVVRSMTIHHSKGLQFNVVFYWSTSKQQNMDTKEFAMTDSQLGLALKTLFLPERYRFSSFHRQVFEYKADMEDLEETLRVLYVALTRPKHKLILVDTVKDDSILSMAPSLSLLKKRRGMTPLMLASLGQQKNFSIHFIKDLVPSYVPKTAKESASLSLLRYSYPSIDSVERISPSQSSHETSGPLVLSLNQGAIYGTRMHELAEKLPNRLWTEDDYEQLQCTDIEKKYLRQFNDHPLYAQALKMDIYKEAPFHISNKNQVIDGIFDFLAVDDNQVILIDFKTDSQINETQLKDRYQDQINFYCTALEHLYPNKKIKAYLYSFFLGKEVLL